MYFTYVVRPGDAPEGRGPELKPFWDILMNFSLRGGFILQLFGYILIMLSGLRGGNLFEIFKVLNGDGEALRSCCIFTTFLGSLIWTVGSVWIQNFRIITDDDVSIKQARGFRAGIKCLNQASLLDMSSFILTSILLLSFLNYFDDDFWTTKHVGSSSLEIFASIARMLHALGLLFYGGAFFLLENFHQEGVAECWGWTMKLVFKVSGILELLCLICTFSHKNSVFNSLVNMSFTLTLGLVLILSLMYAMLFEPLIIKTDVKLTQSAMRNEFYKSRNAMAYYGPPSGIELGTEAPVRKLTNRR